MKRVEKILLLLLVLLLSAEVYAQQRPLYSQFMYNNLSFNPAYAGSQKNLEASFLAREQWVGINGAPTSQLLTVNTALPTRDYGLGLVVANDKVASINQVDISLAGSYKWVISKGRIIKKQYVTSSPKSGGKPVYKNKRKSKKSLSIGGQASYQNYSNELSSLESNLQGSASSDVSFQGSDFSKSLFNFGLGVYYQTDRGYLGLSVPTVLRNTLNNEGATNENHYYLTGGLIFPLSTHLSLQPNVLLRAVSNAPTHLDLNTNIVWKEIITAGFSYRFMESASILLHVRLTKSIRLGYAYDLLTNDLNSLSNGSHELMISFSKEFKSTNFVNPRRF